MDTRRIDHALDRIESAFSRLEAAVSLCALQTDQPSTTAVADSVEGKPREMLAEENLRLRKAVAETLAELDRLIGQVTP